MNRLIDFKSRFRILKGGKISLVVSAFLGGAVIASAAPSGGVVTSGNANISQNGNVTNITQSTQKASINWNKFNIAANETVNFNQPNVNSITLNRVVGNEKSIINGALNANGQVWILNSNGVLFGKNAKVNTAGILATTATLSDADFQNGNYNFKSDSNESVVNLGTIEVSNNAYVVLASNEVRNEGTIKAIRGKVHLTSAKEYTVNLNGNSIVNLIVNKGTLDAMVENKGSIIANGGEIYLTTNAVNELLKGVVNNTGIIEANSLDGLMGKVELFAHGGEVQVGGTITAKDGFVETSGREFTILEDASIKAGEWLIDPVNITIDATLAGTIENALESGDVTIQTDATTANCAGVTCTSANGDGDIIVNSTITWDTANKFTLDAWNDIFINKEITASNAGGKLALLYGQKAVNANNTSDYHINAKVNLHAGENLITKLGSDGASTVWTVVTDATTLQNINTDTTTLAKNYALGSDLTLSGTNNWNPIGNTSTKFTGKLDGLNHKVSNLNISTAGAYVGFFGYTNTGSIIQNIHLENANISSNNNQVGLLVGSSESTIKNAHTSGEIIGSDNVGGLVGYNDGTIKSSSSSAKVTGDQYTGGLVGNNSRTIEKSYATGSVKGTNENTGGLVGRNGVNINNSYATGNVIGIKGVGGLVGLNDSNINNSYATGSVNGTDGVGGLAGRNYETFSEITNSYSIGKVTGTSNVGGLVGDYSGGTVSSNFWDTQTTGQANSAVGMGKTTKEMSYGQMYKNASWDIVVDNSVASTTPILKYDAINNKYVWAIAPLNLSYTLSDKTVDYDGNTQNLSSFYTNVFGEDYSFINDYEFQKDSAVVTGYKDAETYDSIKVASTNEFLTIASSGNTDGKLTITPKAITVKADDLSKIYGESDASLTYTANGLVGSDTLVGSLKRESGENAGKYTISQDIVLANQNYTITFTDGVYTITAKLDPVDPKPDAQTVDLKNIITPITNQTAITVPSMPQLRAMINNPEPAPAQANTPQGFVQETRVPLVNNPIVQIINAGVNLPEGVDQLFFATNDVNQTSQTNEKK